MSQHNHLDLRATLPLASLDRPLLRVRLGRSLLDTQPPYYAVLEEERTGGRGAFPIAQGRGATVDEAVGKLWVELTILQRDAARCLHALRMAAKDLGVTVDPDHEMPYLDISNDPELKGAR